MRTGFPRLGVLRRLRPVPDRSAIDAPSPTTPPAAGLRARPGTVPVFTVVRSSKEEPDYAPAVSLPVRRRPSWQPPRQLMPTAVEVPRLDAKASRQVRTAPGPDPSGSSRCLIKGVSHAGSSRTPLRPARRAPNHLTVLTHPSFVRAAPTLPAVTRVRLPSAPPSCRDRISDEVGVGPGRGSGVSTGPFPRPALRTGHAALTASGAPRIPFGPRGSFSN